MANTLAYIPPHAPPDSFPPVERAFAEPDGLLAAGGDLSPRRLICAYRRGIFPWYSEGQPLLWWSPDPRMVLFPDEVRISRSLAKRLRRAEYTVSENAAFAEVVAACAAPRHPGPDSDGGIWITAAMRDAYLTLFRLGFARSIECWYQGVLVGGLYGVELGQVFFGESMFTRRSDASKVALAHLCRKPYAVIDCQLANAHLQRMGARLIPRKRFLGLLDQWCER